MEKAELERLGMVMVRMEELYILASLDPKETWEIFPIEEIREKCFNQLCSHCVCSGEIADWLEEKITDLLLNTSNQNLVRRMLEWYVGYSSKDSEAKALIFALSLVALFDDRNPGRLDFIERVVSKILVGRLGANQERVLYEQLPGLPGFLRKMLQRLWPPGGVEPSDVYSNEDWACVERALRIIVALGDWTFLPEVDKIIAFIEAGRIKPQDKFFYAAEVHLAILKSAKKLLTDAEREAKSGKK